MSSPASKKIAAEESKIEKSSFEDIAEEQKNFEIYSEGDEILSVENESEKPKLKERNFEFTSSINMMRVIRLIVCLQIIGLSLDSPSVQLPIVFRIAWKLVLSYSVKWYSRPIIDIVYFWQWAAKFLPSNLDNIVFESAVPEVPKFSTPAIPTAPTVPTTPSIRRMLSELTGAAGEMSRYLKSASDYIVQPDNVAHFESEIDFTNERIWHSTKHFSHFFLSALFAAMCMLFTLKFWEIKDYTDRREIREWLRMYVADGWWRRGLAVFTWSMVKGILFLGLIAVVMFAMARQLNVNSIPTPPMIGGGVAIFMSGVAIIYLLGYLGVRATESVFVRYVSQNVSYTSSIILKRVVKAKVDIGIVLMFIVYMPALRSFIEGFFIVTDWNDSLSSDWRRSVNFYTPCYLMAFPPYTQPNIDPQWCPVHYSIASHQPKRAQGYYQDRQILSCDSYLGVSFFTLSFGFFCFTMVGYAWLYWEFIDGCVREMRGSRWVTTLHTLLSIQREIQGHYAEKFPWAARITLDLNDEIQWQLLYIVKAGRWLARSTVNFTKATAKVLLMPFFILAGPFLFIGSRLFLLCCTCFTKDVKEDKSEAQLERERRAAEEEFLKKAGGSMSYSDSIALLKELSLADSLGEEEEFANAKLRISKFGCAILNFVNVLKYPYHAVAEKYRSISYWFKKHPKLNECKVGMKRAWNSLWTRDGKVGLSELGGAHGEWRAAQTIGAQSAKLRNLEIRITEELRIARTDFTSDHSLTITVFDSVIDTSGLFLLISQYHYHRLYWTMVLYVEMTLYVFIAAYANYFYEWKQRLELIIVVNVFFGFLTYLCKPFTEDTDRWLDPLGRLMVSGTLYGIIYCAENMPVGTNDSVSASLYKPWASFDYLKGVSPLSGAYYVFLDCVMSVYMLMYIINVLNVVGFFAVGERLFRSILFGMHDHILDYLINNLEKRAIGQENIFQGLLLVQQWDDVVKEQRRYALMTWPDVRPANLVPTSIKLLEIKWAAFFNLTLKNIRSSLGLSLLHTSMCAADSEVSRWLIHLHPELLSAEDFQRDTPVFIALKECSYFLLKYGEQNGGVLDDGTGYDDDKFLAVYPEINQLRFEAADQGEYMRSLGEVRHLDAFELRNLAREFTFTDTKDNQELRLYRPTFLNFKSKLSKYATQEEIDKEKAEKEAWEALGSSVKEAKEKTKEELQEEAKREVKIAAQEKASLYRKRFPEDDYQDNYESGQMASWGIVGLSVPDINLFIDPIFANFKDTGFDAKDDAVENAPLLENAPVEPDQPADDAASDAGVQQKQNEVRDVEAGDPLKSPPKKPDYNEEDYYDLERPLDLRYNLKSLRAPEQPDKYANIVPANHPALKEMKDWDILRKKKRPEGPRTLLSTMHDAKHLLDATAGWMLGRISLAQKQEKDREVRFKMCKFAEILLSDEIQANCADIMWDISNYKELNRMSSKMQGRIAQNLAMACNINPPAGFTRLSEWTNGISINVFDEFPYEEFHAIVYAAVQLVSATKVVHKHITSVIPTVKRGSRRPGDIFLEHSNKRAGDHPDQEDGFNDRIIHYLSECYCACRKRLDFTDSELSVMGRKGWRGIARALRRNNCTFIIPSMFVGTKQILTTHLNLSRNELDDGDAVLLADVLLYKQSLISLDLSHNRIGARGFIRMCKAMKGHQNIKVLLMGHCRIGPAAGRELGALLKNSTTLEVLDLSYNRMGELVQYPTSVCRERVVSAARDLFLGIRKNRSLQSLDLSYNHLGPVLAEVAPVPVNKHPKLSILNLSGNDMGPKAGASLVFSLGLEPGGDHAIEEREAYYREVKEKQLLGIDVVAEELANVQKQQEKEALAASKGLSVSPAKSTKKKRGKSDGDEDGEEGKGPLTSKLAYLGLNDNQLGRMAGFGLAAMVRNSKTITSLDLCGNNLGYDGGVAFSDGLEKAFGLVPRDFFKKSLYELEERKFTGRNAKVRKVIYTNLTNLNLSQNGIGPTGCQGFMYCMASPNCTITSLDLSRNPMGYTIENGGNAMLAGNDMRTAIANSRSMTHLNLSRTMFMPVDMVPLLGALNRNRALKRLVITGSPLDEPSCLQLAHGISSCPTLTVIDLHNSRLGPKGGLIVVNRIKGMEHRVTYLDISGNGIGPIASIPIGRALESKECAIRTLYIHGNDLMDEGGKYVIKGMKLNSSLTDVDLSNNCLTGAVAEILADVARGLFEDGKKVCDCQLKRLCVSDNPNFGILGAKLLVKAMTASNFTHVELANIGAGPGTGKIIGHHVRDVALNWMYCDVSGNKLSRSGLNEIFWGLRQNRSLRVFKCGDNQAGSIFGSDDDALLGHGIALSRTITANVVLRELDLSYNSLNSNACANIFEAMVENYTIRKLCLRGNLMDDEAAEALSQFFQYNDTCDDLDLGENRMGADCCFVIGEGIKANRSLKTLIVDSNLLNAAGNAPIEIFVRGICLNTSMRSLVMDQNKLGPEWGYQLASAFARNNTLTQVSFRDNRLDNRAGQALLKAFRHAPYMIEMALSADEVGTELWDQFKKVFHAKRSVPDIALVEQETYIHEKNTEILEAYYFKADTKVR